MLLLFWGWGAAGKQEQSFSFYICYYYHYHYYHIILLLLLLFWGWGADWETRTIDCFNLLWYSNSSPSNAHHWLSQRIQWTVFIEEKNHVFHSISFLSTPIKQNTTSKEKDWLWFSWCTSSPSPLSMELPWVPLSNEVFWLYTQNTQTWSGHSCDHSGSRTQWSGEDRWKRNTCSWFLLWGRKPGPGGSSFWTQQLTPGEKCNSTWNLGLNIIMQDFFWTNNMQYWLQMRMLVKQKCETLLHLTD